MWTLPDTALERRSPLPLLAQRGEQAHPLPLYDTAGAQALEKHASAGLPPHRLMQRAGLALARLAAAVAPHARRCWVVAGPGNNGGDGLEAAHHLHRLGWAVHVTLTADPSRLPADAAASLARAQATGVPITAPTAAPPLPLDGCDLIIDALFGRGLTRPVQGPPAQCIALMNHSQAPVLAVDLPSGLPGDTGALWADAPCVQARWTLALLGLPVGLFTGDGRDHAGDIWWDDLGVALPTVDAPAPLAWLEGGRSVMRHHPDRAHRHHKGSFGDVWVVAGAPHMGGAAVLAARAALRAGAGRVYVAPLATVSDPRDLADVQHPELMLGDLNALPAVQLQRATVVAGCGGGSAIENALPRLLQQAGRLVIDADGLNAIAASSALQTGLRQRSGLRPTVLTPHPLEAARLLGTDAATVQRDRLRAAQSLADDFQATVVLKGSGSIVATPGEPPVVLPVGNAALATPGSGDVLAGWLGGGWSQWPQTPPQAATQAAAQASRWAAWRHGWTAEQLRPDGRVLPASELVEHLR